MNLESFIVESWAIEGYTNLGQAALDDFVDAHNEFLKLPTLEIPDIDKAVQVFTYGEGRIRNLYGMNVRVGNYIAPCGGWEVISSLEQLCRDALNLTAYELHQRYEQIHPFMDGNGRSGRMIWLWRMLKENPNYQPTTFLKQWYYQSLENWI